MQDTPQINVDVSVVQAGIALFKQQQLADSITPASLGGLLDSVADRIATAATAEALTALDNSTSAELQQEINERKQAVSTLRTETNTALGTKADTATVNAALQTKADKAYVNEQLDTKASKTTTTEHNTRLGKIETWHAQVTDANPFFLSRLNINQGWNTVGLTFDARFLKYVQNSSTGQIDILHAIDGKGEPDATGDNGEPLTWKQKARSGVMHVNTVLALRNLINTVRKIKGDPDIADKPTDKLNESAPTPETVPSTDTLPALRQAIANHRTDTATALSLKVSEATMNAALADLRTYVNAQLETKGAKTDVNYLMGQIGGKASTLDLQHEASDRELAVNNLWVAVNNMSKVAETNRTKINAITPVLLKQREYDALVAAGTVVEGQHYAIVEDEQEGQA